MLSAGRPPLIHNARNICDLEVCPDYKYIIASSVNESFELDSKTYHLCCNLEQSYNAKITVILALLSCKAVGRRVRLFYSHQAFCRESPHQLSPLAWVAECELRCMIPCCHDLRFFHSTSILCYVHSCNTEILSNSLGSLLDIDEQLCLRLSYLHKLSLKR